jgi:acyl-coenzyme A synthetase/AMP-(fatty) acid ligase
MVCVDDPVEPAEPKRKRGRKEKDWSSVELVSSSSEPLRRQALEWLKGKQILHKQVCHERQIR